MGVQFNWELEEEEPPDDGPFGTPEPSGSFRRFWVFLSVVLTAAIVTVGTIWYLGQREIRLAEAAMLTRVQTVIDQQHLAAAAGDGDLFFMSGPPSAQWRSEQLQPFSQYFWLSNPQANSIERNGVEVWANVEWIDPAGNLRQRVLFFEERGEDLLLLDQSDAFWGLPRQIGYSWGEILFYAADEQWVPDVTNFVGNTVQSICEDTVCPAFTVVISHDLTYSSHSDRVQIASPRITGVDADGDIPAEFWAQLEQGITNQLQPRSIRFAVPSLHLSTYQEFAVRYSALYPDRQVELVALETLSPDVVSLLEDVDGAALTPDIAMVTAGLVHDMTGFITSDPTFDREDFYDQIWRGAWWQDRMWFMPQTARMPLIYFDRSAYGREEEPLPNIQWTWEDMLMDATVFANHDRWRWGMVEIDNDLLYSLAFNAGNSCTEKVTVHCSPQLRDQDVVAALGRYQELAHLIPDHHSLTRKERIVLFQNQVSPSSEHTVLWIDEPQMFEHHFLSRSAGVIPFPGSESFEGVTPLHVQGSMISAFTDRPQDVWHWLNYVSHQYPVRTTRLIPARPSTAENQRYWDTLPPELTRTMGHAFPYTRPILLGEQVQFNSMQLDAVLSGSVTPDQAVDIAPKLPWFGHQTAGDSVVMRIGR